MSGYNLICRICLLQTQNLKVLDSKMFQFCIGIEISNSSSSQICESCNKCLMDSFLFKKKCIDANEIFIKMCDYKIEVLTDNKSDCIQEVFKEEIEDNSYFDATEINFPDETESDYFLSEEETFLEQMKLDAPVKTVITKREFELCYICGERRATNASIQYHIKNIHLKTSESERFSCDKCEKTFKTKDHLKKHKKTLHDSLKAYPCSICDRTFLYWGSRKYHMFSVHGAEPKHSCHLCPYKTQNIFRMKDHINGHTGELPYECEVCEKRFLNRAQMKTHMIVHTKTRDYICTYCSKAFGTSKALKSHIKIHTQERNYVCPVESCSKDFIQNHVLKSHMKANHPEVEIPPSGTIVSKRSKRSKHLTTMKELK